MSDISWSLETQSFLLEGGKTGVLMIHGFLGSPISITPWAKALNEIGLTVSVPRLPGHGTTPEEMNQTTWEDWYECVDEAFVSLAKKCDQIFIAGFSMGGALALRLCQIRGSEIKGAILLNASIYDERKIMHLVPIISKIFPTLPGGDTDVAKPGAPRHTYQRIPLRALNSLRKLWKITERDLYLVDLPIMVAYSLNDHVVHPVCSETIIDNVFSIDVREVIFERSFHNVALDYDAELLAEESITFIEDVISGQLSRGETFAEMDERELIDAEFESIISTIDINDNDDNDDSDEK